MKSEVVSAENCDWLDHGTSGYKCKFRNTNISVAEVTSKCSNPTLASLCVTAYSSLSRARESIAEKSTDAFPWIIDSATHFQSIKEYDNAIMVFVKGIEFAIRINLIEKGYQLFCDARTVFEEAVEAQDPSIKDPMIKRALLKAGNDVIAAMQKSPDESIMADMQAELKASILGGISLKKAEKQDRLGVVVVDGRQLYEKKAREYREGAETYIRSGIVANAIVFVCMAALADLMLGKTKEGLRYLKQTIEDSGMSEKFQKSIVFKWTKLVLKAHIENDVDAIDQARKMYYEIPWSFKDDQEFARRVMDAIFNRLTQES